MKEAVTKLKTEFNAKLLYWNNLKSSKAKAAIILLFTVVIALKVFTTIFTLDWVASLFSV